MNNRSRWRIIRAAAAASLVAAIAVCWIMPYRMAFGPGGSYYTFGYLPDEYFYAQRLQPLLAGASATNPINGVTDPNARSQYYLEDMCRRVVTLTGVNVITFYWIWRLLFPVCVAALFQLLAMQCLPRTRPPWGIALRFAAGGAAFALLYFVHDFVMEPLPPRCWLDRIPTNIEFPVSILLSWQTIRLIDRPEKSRAFVLALVWVALAYLRPYMAVPWAMALAIIAGILLVARQVSVKTAGVAVGTVGIAMIPWMLDMAHNRHSVANAELTIRYFAWPIPYAVHAHWMVHLAFAAMILVSAVAVEKKWRVFAVGTGLSLMILPFICALVPPVGREMLRSDRFGAYYLVILLTLALLIVRRFSTVLSGRKTIIFARRTVFGCIAIVLLSMTEVEIRNYNHDLENYPWGHYASISADTKYVPAYLWVREKTPPDALFIVDDGYNWSLAPLDPGPLMMRAKLFIERNDLFHIVAQRRVVYTDWLVFNVISDEDLFELAMLQRGTFGLRTVGTDVYVPAIKRFQPGYVLWRKTPAVPIFHETAPIPRGFGSKLAQMREVVYSDDVCEIWKINYHAGGQ